MPTLRDHFPAGMVEFKGRGVIQPKADVLVGGGIVEGMLISPGRNRTSPTFATDALSSVSVAFLAGTVEGVFENVHTGVGNMVELFDVR